MGVCQEKCMLYAPVLCGRSGTYLYVCICVYTYICHSNYSLQFLVVETSSFMMLLVTKNTKATENGKVEQC